MRQIMRAFAAALVLLAIGAIGVVSVKANAGGESKTPRKSPTVPVDPFTNDPFGGDSPTAGAAEVGRTGTLPPDRRTPISVYPAAEPARIVEALNAPTRMQFIDFTLGEVVEYLKHLHEIPISLDIRALEEYDIGSDLPITFSADGISLGHALDAMLRAHDLTYTTRNEGLLITTPAFVETDLRIKIYEVTDLVTCRGQQAGTRSDYQPLIHALTATVDPKSWSTAGGLGTIAGHDVGHAKVLAVAQTYHAHHKIDAVLQAFRLVADRAADGGDARK